MKTFAEQSKNSEAAFNKSGKRQNSKSETAAWSFVSSPNSNFQIQRKAECACGGECPTCQTKHSNLPISHPNDASEIEADQIADKVMRTQIIEPVNSSSSKNKVSRKCSECEEEEKLHRKESGNDSTSFAPSIVQDVLNSSGGKSLDANIRAFMEPRFNHNFSNVKIHDNDLAAESASSINALAYTSGKDIVFKSGQYNPTSDSGKRLLAHELAHVVQQSTSLQTKKIQRTIGDGHDLNAVRFRGNVVLEAVYDDEQTLQSGSRGNAVRILQQALIDSGMSLPRFGVDGDFGSETEAAVIAFQRGSGLNGGDRDGIIGPTTMGWLDQRFATTTTPAGTSGGATSGCPAFKTIDVDIVSLRGSTRNSVSDLDYANTVFNQCCVKFNLQMGTSAAAADSDTWLGGDTDLNATNPCGSMSAEQTNLATSAVTTLGLSSIFKVFYVDTITGIPFRAASFPPFCAQGASSSLINMAYVSNSAETRSLAHEFGHILLNNGNHPLLTDNLMNPTNTATGEDLDNPDCATIFANA